MPRIRVPKPLPELMKEVEPQKFILLLGKYGATDRKGRYLHWNEFKWKVEKGDEELAAWVATKHFRQAMARTLPLLQAEGDRCFSYCVPDSLFAHLHAIDQMIGGGQELSDGNSFISSDDKHHYFVKSLMLEEAITSSQLEGASTTREVAKEMLEKSLTPKDKSQQMILNNYRLMKKAIEYKNEELSIDFILELHEIATYKAIENQAVSGELRTTDNIFVSNAYGENSFYPPKSETIRERLTNLCDFANQDHSQRNQNFIHPIIKAIILHFMIAYIHPFGDGNGRTARAIFYWSTLRSRYWLFEYVSISKFIKEKRGAYDKAFIYTETDDFDITYFLYNQVDTIEKAVKSLREYIDQKKQDFYEFMAWIGQNPIAKTLKRGQLGILREALRNPGKEFTAKEVAINFGVTENTARRYLHKLVDQDLLVLAQSKGRKTLLYLAPSNLKARLNL